MTSIGLMLILSINMFQPVLTDNEINKNNKTMKNYCHENKCTLFRPIPFID